MVVINRIQEPISYLFEGEYYIGIINSYLELNDCLIQIKKNKYKNYSLVYENVNYPISDNGRIKKWF